ncbi:hypothetical protein LCGC14_2973540 [marine sediment metagenome]|uniref:Uncharacterized protein n=1 Tax=marine sediment metagenome TaxID=412755 RepID=A0A0F8X8R4_9ZZZZ
MDFIVQHYGNEEIEIVKKTLRILQEDGIINGNEYQGEDFENLLKKIKK